MAGRMTDRNLLFGILALQMDFIDRDELVRAMQAWVLEKARSMGDILVEKGRLTEARRALLDAVVREHLEAHGGDLERSLAAVRPDAAARASLEGLGDADLDASLASVAAGPPAVDSLATKAPTVGASTSAGLRFRILRPHARGGLGEVYIARDEELVREVALKQMQNRIADDPASRARFLLEAEVTGKLEHPGVVPVYGLGQYPDGRPFYAMRFIEGETLKDAIARFHSRHGAGPCRSEAALELRKLLGSFVAVCNVVAYAHSRGVLHRDIKPANIMLGKYGETLVVDWGLAKPFDRPDAILSSAGRPVKPQSGSGSSATLEGTAIGTPQFMSPEQAAGRHEQVGPASDLYSLGATLFHLLTGRPPFESTEDGAVLEMVRRGDFPPPRAVDANVPAALEAVCLRAMANDPGRRYGSAQELAEEVEHWLADEPVKALRDPLGTRAARWARRHKPAVAAAAALLITALIGLATATVLIDREKLRVEAAWQRAERNFQRAREAIDQMLSRVGRDRLESVPGAERVRKELLEEALALYQGLLAEEGEAPELRLETALAHQHVGEIYRWLGRHADAQAAVGKAAAMLGALARRFPAELGYGRELNRAIFLETQLLQETSRFDEALRRIREAIDAQTGLAARFSAEPSVRFDLAKSRLLRGWLLKGRGDPSEEEAEYRESARLLEELRSLDPRHAGYRQEAARAYHFLGWLYNDGKRYEEAEKSYALALPIREGLVAEYPDVPIYREELGYTCNNLMNNYGAMGAFDKALAAGRRTIDFWEKLAADSPTVPQYRAMLGNSLGNLALLYLQRREELGTCVKLLEQAVGHLEAALKTSPDHPEYRRLLLEHSESLAEARGLLAPEPKGEAGRR